MSLPLLPKAGIWDFLTTTFSPKVMDGHVVVSHETPGHLSLQPIFTIDGMQVPFEEAASARMRRVLGYCVRPSVAPLRAEACIDADMVA